jgi:hypothetical protein
VSSMSDWSAYFMAESLSYVQWQEMIYVMPSGLIGSQVATPGAAIDIGSQLSVYHLSWNSWFLRWQMGIQVHYGTAWTLSTVLGTWIGHIRWASTCSNKCNTSSVWECHCKYDSFNVLVL